MKTLTETLNIRTDLKVKKSVNSYAKKLNISKSKIVNDALTDYLNFRLPQILDLKLTIEETNFGLYKEDAEADILFKRLLKSAK